MSIHSLLRAALFPFDKNARNAWMSNILLMILATLFMEAEGRFIFFFSAWVTRLHEKAIPNLLIW